MTIPAYAAPVRDENGEITNSDAAPLWSGKGAPPAIGDVVTTTGGKRLQVTITGYETVGIWLMALGYRTQNPAAIGNLAGAEIDYDVPFTKEAPLPERPALSFGLNAAIPPRVATAWGARLIYPDDLVFNRQDMVGSDREELKEWLNGGALKAALETARQADQRWKLSRNGDQRVILHKDERGVIVACPNRSHGYLYVAGWLHEGIGALQPLAGYEPIVIERDPWDGYQDDDDADDWDD